MTNGGPQQQQPPQPTTVQPTQQTKGPTLMQRFAKRTTSAWRTISASEKEINAEFTKTFDDYVRNANPDWKPNAQNKQKLIDAVEQSNIDRAAKNEIKANLDQLRSFAEYGETAKKAFFRVIFEKFHQAALAGDRVAIPVMKVAQEFWVDAIQYGAKLTEGTNLSGAMKIFWGLKTSGCIPEEAYKFFVTKMGEVSARDLAFTYHQAARTAGLTRQEAGAAHRSFLEQLVERTRNPGIDKIFDAEINALPETRAEVVKAANLIRDVLINNSTSSRTIIMEKVNAVLRNLSHEDAKTTLLQWVEEAFITKPDFIGKGGDKFKKAADSNFKQSVENIFSKEAVGELAKPVKRKQLEAIKIAVMAKVNASSTIEKMIDEARSINARMKELLKDLDNLESKKLEQAALEHAGLLKNTGYAVLTYLNTLVIGFGKPVAKTIAYGAIKLWGGTPWKGVPRIAAIATMAIGATLLYKSHQSDQAVEKQRIQTEFRQKQEEARKAGVSLTEARKIAEEHLTRAEAKYETLRKRLLGYSYDMTDPKGSEHLEKLGKIGALIEMLREAKDSKDKNGAFNGDKDKIYAAKGNMNAFIAKTEDYIADKEIANVTAFLEKYGKIPMSAVDAKNAQFLRENLKIWAWLNGKIIETGDAYREKTKNNLVISVDMLNQAIALLQDTPAGKSFVARLKTVNFGPYNEETSKAWVRLETQGAEPEVAKAIGADKIKGSSVAETAMNIVLTSKVIRPAPAPTTAEDAVIVGLTELFGTPVPQTKTKTEEPSEAEKREEPAQSAPAAKTKRRRF